MLPNTVRLMGEDSLVLVQEPRHKYLRGLLQPAFSAQATQGYLPAIQDLVCRHLAAWEAAGEAGVKGYDGLKLMTYEFIISVSNFRVVMLWQERQPFASLQVQCIRHGSMLMSDGCVAQGNCLWHKQPHVMCWYKGGLLCIDSQ